MTDTADRILDAALMHVPFDGWSDAAFRAAAADAGVPLDEARALFPRGALDLALAFHRRGDAEMVERLKSADLSALRFRDRIAHAVKLRLDLVEPHKEAVRRGTTLFALPMHAAEGARAVWETADAIWTALGDTSEDLNWYTKRATLSGVYSATVLYWLGDQSMEHSSTWAFLDRRIEDVMRFETLKKQVRENRLLKPLLAGPEWFASQVRAPSRQAPADLPGRWRP
ncbi:COQ9 family protein [Roseibacterium sp. SDUM158016]|jgi:ubiquinone biosynthesis protein COQ9|uniref:COQ9 family protein n=1 Tax=Roseicyclus sediminis TaxID=2980997 RepID=UPI0021D161F7|nr:COQ9 family protein [Roseibacterium sp. SDUM158016]MCU4654108.1 COQ9 family protein [Roseibacterium sp. SDUM158016]